MPSNTVTVNGQISYEIPDSKMEVIDKLLHMFCTGAQSLPHDSCDACGHECKSVHIEGCTVMPMEERIGITLDRENLQAIRSSARDQSEIAANPGWKHAYGRLANAADILDAFHSRSEDRQVGGRDGE